MPINPIKYMVNSQPSIIPQHFVENVEQGVRTIGRSGEFAIKLKNTKYVLAKKASDIIPELKGVTPVGWPKGTTWDDCPAIYSEKMIGCFYIDKSSMPEYVRHETGHGLDYVFKNIIGSPISQTKGYTDCYVKDLKRLKGTSTKLNVDEKELDYLVQGGTPQEPSENGREETFANIYAKIRGGSTSPVDDELEELFPKTFAYVKKLLWYLGDKS